MNESTVACMVLHCGWGNGGRALLLHWNVQSTGGWSSHRGLWFDHCLKPTIGEDRQESSVCVCSQVSSCLWRLLSRGGHGLGDLRVLGVCVCVERLKRWVQVTDRGCTWNVQVSVVL